jgi:hypothetical protein
MKINLGKKEKHVYISQTIAHTVTPAKQAAEGHPNDVLTGFAQTQSSLQHSSVLCILAAGLESKAIAASASQGVYKIPESKFKLLTE